LQPRLLLQFYPAWQLNSELARRVFLLPHSPAVGHAAALRLHADGGAP
jgi:hypothetical protein